MKQNANNQNNLGPMIIIGALFFLFGFVTWLNATLIPYLKIACELNDFEAFLVTTAFYISYFFMALPSSTILEKVGFKNGMALGLIIMGIGSLIFVPAAMTRMYSLFLLGLFVQGLGLAVLQTASNPYITVLGPIESAAKRISFMGIANKVAGILSPILLGMVVLSGTDELTANLEIMNDAQRAVELNLLANKVILPYILMAVVLFILAFGIRYSKLPEIEEEETEELPGQWYKRLRAVLKVPYLALGFVAIFLYVGAEVIAVDTMAVYGKYLGYTFEEAKYYPSFTLVGMLLGYVVGIIAIPKFLSQQKALSGFAILGLIFTILAVLTKGVSFNLFDIHWSVSILFLALLGFANSVMWPAIWPLAIDKLGKLTKIGSAILIMGIAGGALLPPLFAIIKDLLGGHMHLAYLLLIICYLFILFYAVKGHKIGKPTH